MRTTVRLEVRSACLSAVYLWASQADDMICIKPAIYQRHCLTVNQCGKKENESSSEAHRSTSLIFGLNVVHSISKKYAKFRPWGERTKYCVFDSQRGGVEYVRMRMRRGRWRRRRRRRRNRMRRIRRKRRTCATHILYIYRFKPTDLAQSKWLFLTEYAYYSQIRGQISLYITIITWDFGICFEELEGLRCPVGCLEIRRNA